MEAHASILFSFAMRRFNLSLNFLPPLALGLGLLLVYLATLAPGLTWSHFGADGGDLITAAATGGVAHPGGYPLYLLVSRLFQFLPFGSLAYRTNLLSALATVAAALLLYWFLVRRLPDNNPGFSHLAGLVAGFVFGFAPLVWSQALITEVYALHIFFVGLIFFLTFSESTYSGNRSFDLLIGLMLGLALGNHITSLLLLPVVFGMAFQSGRHGFWRFSWRLAGLAAGLLVYLTLPLRALSESPVIWGNPATLEGFFWLVSGELYRTQFFSLSFADLLGRVAGVAALFLGQFGLSGLLLGLAGMFSGRVTSALQRSLAWVSLSSVFLAIGYATSDSFIYTMPALLCFAIWLGFGLSWLMDTLADWPRVPWLLVLIFLVILLFQTGQNWSDVDASKDVRAETFGAQVISSLPADALVFARGDQAVFSLWYFHFALEQRPDLIVVAADLLHFPWYLQNLRAVYPGLQISEPYPFPETLSVNNPTRPSCSVEYVDWAQVYCQPAAKSDE